MFDTAIAHVLAWEGGYNDDPDDPGGETNYGISKRSYPDVDIKLLTLDDAKTIYKRDYWVPAGCEQITDTPLAQFHFDTAVNLGVRRANRMLQIAVGVPRVDGIYGPTTAACVDVAVFQGCDVIGVYALDRIHHYTHLALSDPKRSEYLLGWLRRTLAGLGRMV